MGNTIIIARVPKIEDRDTINIIARNLDKGDCDSVAIAIVGNSADANINARNLDIEDRNSVAIAIVGNSADANINARDLDIEDCGSVAIVIVGNPHGGANDHDIHDITGP